MRRATGGSEAIDIALQLAMVHTGCRRFLSLEGSDHGNAIGGLSIAIRNSRDVQEPAAELWQDRTAAHCESATADRDAFKKRDVAAFILEPIGINLGVQIHSGGTGGTVPSIAISATLTYRLGCQRCEWCLDEKRPVTEATRQSVRRG